MFGCANQNNPTKAPTKYEKIYRNCNGQYVHIAYGALLTQQVYKNVANGALLENTQFITANWATLENKIDLKGRARVH